MIVVALVGCAHTPTSHGPDLSWLTGTWVTEDGDTVTTETWRDDLTATNTTTKDGNVVHTETIRIERRDGETFYVASPSGQATTAFRLTTATSTSVTFENPDHDYPKRIRYERRGDSLVATISGDGRSSAWRFSRR